MVDRNDPDTFYYDLTSDRFWVFANVCAKTGLVSFTPCFAFAVVMLCVVLFVTPEFSPREPRGSFGCLVALTVICFFGVVFFGFIWLIARSYCNRR